MRSSWLYFAVRSERAENPVLICPQLVATANGRRWSESSPPER
jgi:hypothetical protein